MFRDSSLLQQLIDIFFVSAFCVDSASQCINVLPFVWLFSNKTCFLLKAEVMHLINSFQVGHLVQMLLVLSQRCLSLLLAREAKSRNLGYYQFFAFCTADACNIFLFGLCPLFIYICSFATLLSGKIIESIFQSESKHFTELNWECYPVK